MEIEKIANISIAGAALAISIIGLVLSLFTYYIKKGYKRYLITIFSVMTLCAVSNLVLLYVTDSHEYKHMIISYVCLFFESLFSAMIIPILTAFLLFCAGKYNRKNPLIYISVGLLIIYLALLIFTQFTKYIYYYTPDNNYFRGEYYPVLLVPPILLMAVNLFALIRYRTDLPRRYLIAFSVYFSIPLLCMIAQIFYSGVLLTMLGSSVAALFMLGIIVIDHMEQTISQTQEIAQQKASINVLQMRPHFIYNTMMSIYYLIAQDTEKAQKITLDFSTYLRKNFTAIAKDGPVPFTEELEHTRAYLAVEETRFEDDLFVEFDTPYTRFRIPPLTLQPIVENAIKHGLDPELSPLHVTIKTNQTKEGNEITVEDTGPGFEANDNNEPHVALANVKERLQMMCGGTLTISPRENGGTKVTVFIPHK